MSDDERILSHTEVLAILSEQATNGSVSAAIALERALRAHDRKTKGPLEEELEALIQTKPS